MNPEQIEKAILAIWTEVLAVESALVDTGKMPREDLDTFRMLTASIAAQKLNKIKRETSSGA
jgi:hypothetical protein